MTRRNATPQDAQHVVDMLAGLSLEDEGAAQILVAVHESLSNSFVYCVTGERAPLAAAVALRLAADGFFHPSTLPPAPLADAKAFGAGMGDLALESRAPA